MVNGRHVAVGTVLVLTAISLCLSARDARAQGNVASTVSVDFDAPRYAVSEGSTVPVKVRLSARPGRSVELQVTVRKIGGVTTADYAGVPAHVTFAPHDTEKTFIVKAIADKIIEDGEMIELGLGGTLPDGVSAGRPATATVTFTDNPDAVASDYNVLSELRARITGGVVIANGSSPRVDQVEGASQLDQTSNYLAFEVIPRFGPPQDPDAPRDRHVYLEPFVNVRLTTIPVASAGSDAATVKAPDASILQSQKTAQVQLGAVGNLASFFIRSGGADKQYHWGVGIVARKIFQSVTATQRTRRVWNIDDDLYDAHTVGVRLTLRERSGNARRWMPVAYIDVSHGKFQNLESVTGVTEDATNCLMSPGMCLERGLPPEDAFHTEEEDRLYVEARMFIDPLYFGFDLNNGAGLDDFRIYVGVTVGLNTLFARKNQE